MFENGIGDIRARNPSEQIGKQTTHALYFVESHCRFLFWKTFCCAYPIESDAKPSHQSVEAKQIELGIKDTLVSVGTSVYFLGNVVPMK
jgi:hypothetical protein